MEIWARFFIYVMNILMEFYKKVLVNVSTAIDGVNLVKSVQKKLHQLILI